MKILLHAGFFVSGISTVLIGQLLPILAEKFKLNDEQAGNFFPAQFAGSLVGTFLTNSFGKRNKFLTASLIGCFLMAGGVLMLNFASFELCLFGFFVNGIGIGLTLPSINMLILELNPLRPAAGLSVLNFCWGLGAILSQPFVNFFSRGTNIFAPTLILAATLFVIAVSLVLMPKGLEQKPLSSDESAGDFEVPIWTNPVAWAIAAFNFIHVGFESAMGGWLETYTQRIEDGGRSLPFLPPIVLYFVFFVVGRGVAPVFFRFLNENRMLILSLLVILLGMGILLFARDVWTLSIGAGVAGFGTSSVFPTNMSRFTKTFGASASRRAMPFFICGTLGAAFTTWIIGYISNHSDSLRSGMFVLLGSVLILIVMQTVLSLSSRVSDSKSEA